MRHRSASLALAQKQNDDTPAKASGPRETLAETASACATDGALGLRHQGHLWPKRRLAVPAYPDPTETHHFRLRARAKRRFRAVRSRLVSGRKELFCAS